MNLAYTTWLSRYASARRYFDEKIATVAEKEGELKNTPKPIDLPNLNEIPETRQNDPIMEIL